MCPSQGPGQSEDSAQSFQRANHLSPVGPWAALCKGPYSHGHVHELFPEKGPSLELASSPSSEMREVALRKGAGGRPWEEPATLLLFAWVPLGQGADRHKRTASQGQADDWGTPCVGCTYPDTHNLSNA